MTGGKDPTLPDRRYSLQRPVWQTRIRKTRMKETIPGIMIPFLGTTLGAACVFFLKTKLRDGVRRALAGFAAGVMTAASVWSLLLPAIEQAESLAVPSFLPALIGFWGGITFLLLIDLWLLRILPKTKTPDGGSRRSGKIALPILAITLHNLPEGMAVGAVYAGYLAGNEGISQATAFALAFGIAVQNIPEGAIVSLPLHASGMKKGKAFFGGAASGIVEPLGAAITIAAASLVLPLLPYFLAFAAGAMIYVAVKELIPESVGGENCTAGLLFYAAGFSLMMILDVALG